MKEEKKKKAEKPTNLRTVAETNEMRKKKGGTRTTRARNKQRWKEGQKGEKATKPTECMKEREKQ
jgi:hypothetical protein